MGETATTRDPGADADYDVLVVGGGPAGCSTGVFTARAGLETAVYRVVAATRYDANYLRPLDDEGEMFVTRRHGGEEAEYFDREYADGDGRTPVAGLYVASPVAEASAQAITAAGHGALVGRHVVGDARREQGYWDDVAERVDWVRRESARSEEWGRRERWREFFEERVPDDHAFPEGRRRELREDEIDDRLAAYVGDEEIERRKRRAHDRLLERIDTERIRAYLRRVDGADGADSTDGEDGAGAEASAGEGER